MHKEGGGETMRVIEIRPVSTHGAFVSVREKKDNMRWYAVRGNWRKFCREYILRGYRVGRIKREGRR